MGMARWQGGAPGNDRARERTDEERAVYIISVAAELAGVHPQTLRIYERKGLLRPARTPGNTRRYSERDIARLQMIQRLTQEYGINLAGVKMIVEMENELERMRLRMERMDRELARVRRRMHEELERARGQSSTADIVPLAAIRRLLLELGLPAAEAGRGRAERRGPIPVGPGMG
jgi:MerR family transcriptional regulator/heat shock protein HspR